MADDGYSVVFAGGGTGGHLYPGLVVAAELQRSIENVSISFVGARRGIEQRLVPLAGYPLFSLRISGIKGRGLVSRALAAAAAGWAVVRSFCWMFFRRPDLVIGIGGYASGPAVLAANGLNVPTMIMEQNHFPGATNRWLAPRVRAVCVPSAAAAERLGGRTTVTGNPVRREFFESGPLALGSRLSILVFGGSRGAHSINVALPDLAAKLAKLETPPRVVHQTGVNDEAAVREAVRHYPADLYEVHSFLDDMPARLAAADLVICRAGASTLAELTAAGRPAILVPYPQAADDHQRHNAVSLSKVGAAEVVTDTELDGGGLAGVCLELLADRERLREMAQASRRLANPEATQRIVEIARELLDAGRDADVS